MFQYHKTNYTPYKLSYDEKGIIPLVELCPDLKEGYRMFATISPNPNTKHPVLREIPFKNKTRLQKIKVKYKDMTHTEQYTYLIDYIEKVYLPLLESPAIAGVMELNKEANMHAHFILKSATVKNDTMLMVFRRNIKTDLNTMINQSKNGTDYMNNVVQITKPYDEIVTYMSKINHEVRPLFKNYFLKNI